MTSPGASWLGLAHEDEHRWRLPVTESVISGAGALYGGCATAAAVTVAAELSPQPIIWASSHFALLARLGSDVTVDARVVSSARTMTHVEVVGTANGAESFVVRVAAGDRAAVGVGGHWAPPPPVPEPDDLRPFDHPVHTGTWASRFDWRLAGRGTTADPWAAWWVRPVPPAADDLVSTAVLVDYVTYGIGRALDVPMGGLSVDNVVRVHRVASAPWLLLVVRPESISGGFGHGAARVYAAGELVATGTQSMVMNSWDWRLPDEREH